MTTKKISAQVSTTLFTGPTAISAPPGPTSTCAWRCGQPPVGLRRRRPRSGPTRTKWLRKAASVAGPGLAAGFRERAPAHYSRCAPRSPLGALAPRSTANGWLSQGQPGGSGVPDRRTRSDVTRKSRHQILLFRAHGWRASLLSCLVIFLYVALAVLGLMMLTRLAWNAEVCLGQEENATTLNGVAVWSCPGDQDLLRP